MPTAMAMSRSHLAVMDRLGNQCSQRQPAPCRQECLAGGTSAAAQNISAAPHDSPV